MSVLTGGVPAQTQEAVLYSFGAGNDGNNPNGALTNVNGVLYGTTNSGGANGKGTVFTITTSGVETVLHSFGAGNDGTYPSPGLINVNGVLYGTTSHGGDGDCGGGGCGTVFTITASGTESVLYRFAGGRHGDGSSPNGLTEVNGVLYGMTENDGAHLFGTVFKITMSGAESVLYSFAGGSDGEYPRGGLTSVNGALYGTTENGGGADDSGIVFKITTSGKESILHSFTGGSSDGAFPNDLTAVNGVLYGTTQAGGAFGSDGDGTVYKITTSGTEKVLHDFGGGNDGKFPYAGLTNVNGVLYGTTTKGGSQTCSGGCGTVFKITPFAAKGAVYSFAGGSDGIDPFGDLTYVNGVVYGTTLRGGANGGGTAFSLSL